MVKILIPQEKTKQNKPLVRGFWKNPTGRIYYDYLSIQEKELTSNYDLQKTMDNLKNLYNQEAIFYINDSKAFIYNNKKDIVELSQKHSELIPKDKKVLKKAISKYLKIYGGFTVFIEPLAYRLESWSI
jgi:hypothetical protein